MEATVSLEDIHRMTSDLTRSIDSVCKSITNNDTCDSLLLAFNDLDRAKNELVRRLVNKSSFWSRIINKLFNTYDCQVTTKPINEMSVLKENFSSTGSTNTGHLDKQKVITKPINEIVVISKENFRSGMKTNTSYFNRYAKPITSVFKYLSNEGYDVSSYMPNLTSTILQYEMDHKNLNRCLETINSYTKWYASLRHESDINTININNIEARRLLYKLQSTRQNLIREVIKLNETANAKAAINE